MTDRNPAQWPSLWLALMRPREYDRRMSAAESVSRKWRDERMREVNLKIARTQVARLREHLSPETLLNLQQSLAAWEAHLSSLEDDGVFAIPKGHE